MSNTLRVAVTGGSGVLGRALSALRPDWRYLSRTDCDVYDGPLRAVIDRAAPDVVLHAAALTDHQHPNAADVIRTNIIGTQRVASVCARRGIPLVYLSTHYVYAGVNGYYSESDFPRPIGVYAMSKWAGEVAVQSVMPGSKLLVVRGSWYTRETRLDGWARRGALVDAYCSREPVEQAAAKIVALVEGGVIGVVNIGGARRSFVQIMRDEGYEGCTTRTRAELDDAYRSDSAPYPFPADTSVDTSRFDALGLDWRVH